HRHVDAGEDYDSSARREIGEELGIETGDRLEYLFKLPAIEDTGMEFIRVYRCFHNGPFRLAPGEIDEGQWFSTQTLSKRVRDDDPQLTRTFKMLWSEFCRLNDDQPTSA
ncbi:MAG: NUDIX domain-containing protein, partial [Gammaproteobacteria bacterium]